MRIGIVTPGFWESTGYGVQSAHLARMLVALGHDVAGFSFTGLHGAPIMWEGIPVYPSIFADMGQDLSCHARHFKADIVIPIMDAWVMEMHAWEGQRLCPFFPVDHSPLSPHLRERLPQFFQPIVYSQWGQQVCKDAGHDVAYIPCAVDCEAYAPMDRSEAREALGWPQDRFIVGMVQANVGRPSRKAFEVQLRAFKLFHVEHPDTLLYLHTFANSGNETDGENLIRMLDTVGLVVDKDVFFVDQYQYLLSVPPAQMALAYNAMNVLMGVTQKEGFGVPFVEAEACGTPVIMGDWTANAELCFAGWKVPRLHAEVYGRTIYDDDLYGALGGYGVQPRVSTIVEELERAYQTGDTLRDQARAGAIAYDVRRVAVEYWQPLLGEIEARIKAEEETRGANNSTVSLPSDPPKDDELIDAINAIRWAIADRRVQSEATALTRVLGSERYNHAQKERARELIIEIVKEQQRRARIT